MVSAPTLSPGDGHAPTRSRIQHAWQVLQSVPDPEIPIVSVLELGLVRAIDIDAHGALDITFSPTYCACPATDFIMASMARAIEESGLGPVRVKAVHLPAWSTDAISPDGRRKLLAAGIAPPGEARRDAHTAPIAIVRLADRDPDPACPRCGTQASGQRLSRFGSTACKALYRCRACGEPFEYFKPL